MSKVLLLYCAFMIGSPFYAQLKPVAYNDGGQRLQGIWAAPVKQFKTRPGILILPAWMGISDHEKEVAKQLGNLGYAVFIADIYGEGNYPKSTQDAAKQSGYYKKNYKEYQHRASLALQQLVSLGANPENIVAIGYCFGGTGVLEMARAHLPVSGVVSFHGGLGKEKGRANEIIQAKVLVLHGADDPHVPAEDIASFQREMREGKADWQMNYYGNAVHAFTEKSAGDDNSKGVAYNEKADRRSWQEFLRFLDETLQE